MERRCKVCELSNKLLHVILATDKTIVDTDPYGTTESARIDGTAISSFVSWDSKITTVVALLGGVQDLVRQKMKQDGIYNEFIKIAKVRETELWTVVSCSNARRFITNC